MNKNTISSIKKIFKNSPNLNFLNNSSFLITGGTGMLLTYTVLFLMYLNRIKKKNIKICLIGENIYKYKMKIKKFTLLKGIKFIKIKKEFHANFKNLKFDFIIHAAGAGDPVEYNKNKKKLVEDNLISTINLLELAEKKKN
jgi:nucleoside-diphosphate-sugar epimerase